MRKAETKAMTATALTRLGTTDLDTAETALYRKRTANREATAGNLLPSVES